MEKPRWIDISLPIRDHMVHWPGNPEVHISYAKDQSQGDAFAVSRLSFGSHCGTHLDAPRHFFETGPSTSDWDPDRTIGPARVFEVPPEMDAIGGQWLQTQDIPSGARVLFKTRNSQLWKKADDSFHDNYVALEESAARFLSEKRARCVGVDYLSVGPKNEKVNTEVHRVLLGAGVWIIEGLNLADITPGPYELLCLPLPLENRDGAPVRALLKHSS